MRLFFLLVCCSALAAGCSKSKPPEAGNGKEKPEPKVEETTDSLRAGLLRNLQGNNEKAKQDALDELAAWVDSDPATVPALVELLKDRTTAGLGKTHPMRICSTREAAARVLALGGPKGEAALKNQGFAVLRAGLADKLPAVREHTAYTIGVLGPIARPLSVDVMQLCTDPDTHVHGAAFDALRSIGITEVSGFAKLLTHENPEIGKLAAEQIPSLRTVPESAVPSLVGALGSDVVSIRTAAAAALTLAGPKAAPAAEALAEAIDKTEAYRMEFDPERAYTPGPEMAYWRALAAIGPDAVAPIAGLLAHKHPIVRGYAAETLGQIGAGAKPAADKLRDKLKDPFGFVAVEAACALCRIGESADEAAALVKRAMDAPNNVAMTAIDAIPRMGKAGQTLVPAALEKLASPNPFARYAAVGLVGKLPAGEAAKAAAKLGPLLGDPEPVIRRRAAFVLEQLGPIGAPAAEALGSAIATEKMDTLRDQYVDALIAMGAGARPALPALLPLAAAADQPVERRVRVIAAIAVADPGSQAVAAALLAAADDGEAAIRAAAARAIARLEPLPPAVLAKLVALAKSDPRTAPRLAALRALAAAGPRAASTQAEIEPLAAGKQFDGLALQARVAVAAMSGDSKKAAETVRAGLADRRPDLRAAAAAALVELGPEPADLPLLIKLLRDRNAETREAAARCIARLGPAAKDAVPPLTRLLDDIVSDVRIAAALALGEMGPAALSAVAKLRTTVRNDRTAEPAARKALEKLGVKDAAPRKTG